MITDIPLECTVCGKRVALCQCEDIDDRMEVYIHSLKLIMSEKNPRKHELRVKSALDWNKFREAPDVLR